MFGRKRKESGEEQQISWDRIEVAREEFHELIRCLDERGFIISRLAQDDDGEIRSSLFRAPVMHLLEGYLQSLHLDRENLYTAKTMFSIAFDWHFVPQKGTSDRWSKYFSRLISGFRVYLSGKAAEQRLEKYYANMQYVEDYSWMERGNERSMIPSFITFTPTEEGRMFSLEVQRQLEEQVKKIEAKILDTSPLYERVFRSNGYAEVFVPAEQWDLARRALESTFGRFEFRAQPREETRSLYLLVRDGKNEVQLWLREASYESHFQRSLNTVVRKPELKIELDRFLRQYLEHPYNIFWSLHLFLAKHDRAQSAQKFERR